MNTPQLRNPALRIQLAVWGPEWQWCATYTHYHWCAYKLSFSETAYQTSWQYSYWVIVMSCAQACLWMEACVRLLFCSAHLPQKEPHQWPQASLPRSSTHERKLSFPATFAAALMHVPEAAKHVPPHCPSASSFRLMPCPELLFHSTRCGKASSTLLGALRWDLPLWSGNISDFGTFQNSG